MTFNEEEMKTVAFNADEDEDKDGPQIERGTVFHRDTCHSEIYQRSSRDNSGPV